MHLTQLANLQVELRETHAHADSLRDQLSAEIRCADRAEAQLDMLKTLRGEQGPRGSYHVQGGVDDYWSNSRQRYGSYREPYHPVHQRKNLPSFDSPTNPISHASEFQVGSSSPLTAASGSSMRASEFTVTISPCKPLMTVMEGSSVENPRVTEILTDETALVPSEPAA